MRFRSFNDAPANFRVETTFDSRAGIYKIILNIPIFRNFISELLIKQGKIYLRPYKVDPSLPEHYLLEGFTVRNMSQRKDGTYPKSGSVVYFKTAN